MTTSIDRLLDLGQSTWLDYLDRKIVKSGELERLVQVNGVRGITSNPTIFEKAIAHSNDYDDIVLGGSATEPAASRLERLMVHDIGQACDVLRPVYDASGGADGFVSIEVAPSRAHDAAGSIADAKRLWRNIGRPNLMVKIPGTREGLAAIEDCLTLGININITLLFSVERYLEVAEAYFRALERRIESHEAVERLASVASFFVSRIDAKVDPALDALPNALRGAAGALRGRIAIANAKRAYGELERLCREPRWQKLAAAGARRQRLLWASTSPKDPSFPDIYYIEALIGAGTIDTMTPECLRAYLERGRPAARLAEDLDRARTELVQIRELGVDLPRVLAELEREGVEKFAASFDKTVRAIEERRAGRSLEGGAHSKTA